MFALSIDDDARQGRVSTKVTGRRAALAPLPMLALLAGCGENWADVFPVSGTVKFDNEIPMGAQIVLHPVNPAAPNAVPPMGQVKPDGSFVITSYEAGDGAPPGEYVATIQWFRIDKDGNPGPNVIPTDYTSPKTSPIKVTVNGGGPNQLEPITITSAKKAASRGVAVGARR